jgi:hypothetical protein
MVAACRKLTGIVGSDPCLKDCNVHVQKEVLVSLGKANLSVCADQLMVLIEMAANEAGISDDDGSDDMKSDDEEIPDYSCIVGCKAKLNSSMTDITEATLDGLKCMDWSPLLFSLKGSKCVQGCTQVTKSAIRNTTAIGDAKECQKETEEAQDEEEREENEEKEAAEEEAATPKFDCLVGCKGLDGKPTSLAVCVV